MAKIILWVLFNLLVYLIATVAGQERLAQVFSGEVGPLEMALAIIGATIACQIYINGSSARESKRQRTANEPADPK